MPHLTRDFILLGIAALVVAWFVLDNQRSLSEKLGLVVIVAAIYIVFQYLSGASLSEIFNSLGQSFL